MSSQSKKENRAAPGADENDSGAMGEIIGGAKLLQAELGGLVLLVHHTGKDATKGLRGHSSLHAALDAAIVVTREGDRREWATAKAKDGDDAQGYPFRLEVVEIDTDDDGEPITSCIVSAEEHTGEVMRRALPPKSGNQRIIWDALGAMFRDAGTFTPEGAPKELPAGRPCLRLDEAIAGTRPKPIPATKLQSLEPSKGGSHPSPSNCLPASLKRSRQPHHQARPCGGFFIL